MPDTARNNSASMPQPPPRKQGITCYFSWQDRKALADSRAECLKIALC